MPIKTNAMGRTWDAVQKDIAAIIGDLKQLKTSQDNYDGNSRLNWIPGIRKHMYSKLKWITLKGCAPHTFCDICGLGTSIQGLQLDHQIPYDDYIAGFTKQCTRFEARLLYNDPENLRVICSICNNRHNDKQAPFKGTRADWENYVWRKIYALVPRQ